MTVREKMRKWRKRHGLEIRDVSKSTGISGYLIGMVEDGWVTHPEIAKKLGVFYKLRDEEIYELMPEHHRPNNPNYEPNRYAPPDEDSIRSPIISPRDHDEFKYYICEKQNAARRQHQKRGDYAGI